MRASVEIITPHVAKEMLERMETNRPLSDATVSRYARDMAQGRWNNNGQGIVLSEDGTLLDGQHRLRAVLVSQTPISMLVVRGADKKTFITMDSGKPRVLSDVLAIQGFKYTVQTAAISKIAFGYTAGAHFGYQPTKTQLEEFVHRHPYIHEVAEIVGSRQGVFPKSAVGAVVFLANEKRVLTKEVHEFVEGLFYGQGLWKGDGRHTLREWFVQQRNADGPKKNMRPETVFAAVARAWNAYAGGREIHQLRALERGTRHNLPILGFDRLLYGDVPEVVEVTNNVQRTNLPRKKIARPEIVRAAPTA
jgi:hypothetical protein